MNRQTWALEPGQIAAALFSDEVDDDEKSRIASRILALMPANFVFPTVAESMPNYSSESPVSSESSIQTLFDFVTPPRPSIRPSVS